MLPSAYADHAGAVVALAEARSIVSSATRSSSAVYTLWHAAQAGQTVGQARGVARGPRIVVVEAAQLAAGKRGRQLLRAVVVADDVGMIGAEQLIVELLSALAKDAEHVRAPRQPIVVRDE